MLVGGRHYLDVGGGHGVFHITGQNIKEGVNCEFEVNCLEQVQNLKAEVEKIREQVQNIE